jgi:hypothetical protein
MQRYGKNLNLQIFSAFFEEAKEGLFAPPLVKMIDVGEKSPVFAPPLERHRRAATRYTSQ